MTWKQWVLAGAVGFGGVLVGLGCVHLWQDHANLHALVNMVNQQAQQAQRPVAPPVKPPQPPQQ